MRNGAHEVRFSRLGPAAGVTCSRSAQVNGRYVFLPTQRPLSGVAMERRAWRDQRAAARARGCVAGVDVGDSRWF